MGVQSGGRYASAEMEERGAVKVMDQFFYGLLEIVHAAPMNYTAARYFLFVALTVVLYYVLPRKVRWTVLMISSGYFYYVVSDDRRQLLVFAMSIAISYFAGILMEKIRERNTWARIALGIGIIASAAPLIASKCGDFLTGSVMHRPMVPWIIPIGLSFYSMQMIAYLADIYKARITPQKNLLKYALFISFFPIIIQGPISRYDQLESQLFEGHSYDNERLMRGIQLILWGLFLKYLIADKASVVVDTVFDSYPKYAGFYILTAAVLYSIQLYADFLSCVTISQGVAGLYGIELTDNFSRPYFSTSVKEFWRRWHISLSGWLRDYIYIPLGGSRKGKIHKYGNLVITFAVSGLWHGGRWKYLFWGLMHAGYQIAGDLLYRPKDYILERLSLPQGSKMRKALEMTATSFLVSTAWIIFRASTLKTGVQMILSMFSTFNPWIFFNDSIFRLGLTQREFGVLSCSVLIFVTISLMQEKGIEVRGWFNRQNTAVRWAIYLCGFWCMWLFGTYGHSFNAADFIYGGF